MGSFIDAISDDLALWINKQPMFFVATAPRDGGHVNLSPKGHDTLRIINANQVAYLDLTGSGVETIAHLRQNGRITIMFCAFDGPPRIVRLYGTGRVTLRSDPGFDVAADGFPTYGGARSIITVDVHRVGTSCGFGVPEMQNATERTRLLEWAEKKGTENLPGYWASKNAASLDGLIGIEP